MSTASLPMYDIPEVRPALDALWSGMASCLRREGVGDVPRSLDHDQPMRELWRDPALLLSQCCGYDLINRHAERLRPIATPHYAAPGCSGRHYTSFVVVAEGSAASRIEDLRGTVCAINGRESHSGMNALRALVAPLNEGGRFFSAVKVSGAHRDSLAMIARGEAALAAIDCVTYALLARHRAAAVAGIRVLCRTAPAPAVPYVARAEISDEMVERLRSALFAAFAAPDLRAAREDLLLDIIEPLAASAYQPVSDLQAFAERCGYPVIQ